MSTMNADVDDVLKSSQDYIEDIICRNKRQADENEEE